MNFMHRLLKSAFFVALSALSLAGAAGCSSGAGDDASLDLRQATSHGDSFGGAVGAATIGRPPPEPMPPQPGCIDNVYCMSGTHFDKLTCRCEANNPPTDPPAPPVHIQPHPGHTGPLPNPGGGSLW
jgi:hypothetical protein